MNGGLSKTQLWGNYVAFTPWIWLGIGVKFSGIYLAQART